MVTETLACPACNGDVPRGRLSCPHCGTVLAAVARPYAPETPAMAPLPEGPAVSVEALLPAEVRPPPPGAWLPPAALDEDLAAATFSDNAGLVPPPFGAPAGSRTMPDVLQPMPAWPSSGTDASAPPAATESTPPAKILPRAWDPAAAAEMNGAAPTVDRTRGLSLPGLDRERVEAVADVTVLAGIVATLVAFLVPWSTVVIGARGSGSYFDTWGLAGPANVVVFLLALGALALAAIPNPIGRWLRTGVVGLALGPLVLGMAWPYAFGPLPAGPGIILLVIAAVVLLVGGLTSTVAERHGGSTPAV